MAYEYEKDSELLFIQTVPDEKNALLVATQIRLAIQEVEAKLNKSGIECQIGGGLMTWDPIEFPLKEKYPWAYKK